MKEGYKQTELGVIPVNWDIKKLRDCSIIPGKYGINAPAVEFSNDLPTYLRITDIDDDGNFINFNKVSVNDMESNNFLLENEDLVFARTGATVGKSYLHNSTLNGNLVYAGFLIMFRLKREILLPYYLRLFTQTEKYWNWVKTISMRSGQPGINSNEYCSLQIPLPPIEEQNAIANCLSTWNETIEKQQKLIDAKEIRHKALMQKLLSGKKRLPGFTDEWKEVKLGDVCIFKNGKAHESIIEDSGDFILVNSKFISTNGKIQKRVSKDLSPLKLNDLVFVMSDVPNGKALAKFFYVNQDNLYSLNQRIGLLRVKNGNSKFYFYLLNRNRYFLEFDNGVGQTNLKKDDILDCPLSVPTLKEQEAISSLLEASHSEIKLEQEILYQFKEQKKALMQKLLTGKVRLPLQN